MFLVGKIQNLNVITICKDLSFLFLSFFFFHPEYSMTCEVCSKKRSRTGFQGLSIQPTKCASDFIPNPFHPDNPGLGVTTNSRVLQAVRGTGSVYLVPPPKYCLSTALLQSKLMQDPVYIFPIAIYAAKFVGFQLISFSESTGTSSVT